MAASWGCGAATSRARSPAQEAEIVADALAFVWPLIGSSEVRPVIDHVLPLADAAHRVVEASEHIGKLLLTTT